MDNNILFSIITPTYNRPEMLKQAIMSVVRQSYTSWEMIIVNDSPKKDYTQIENGVLSHELKHKIYYYKNDRNRGVNFTRNFALQHTSPKSDYIVFLDDDDQLSENALQDLFEFIISEKHQVDWLITNKKDLAGQNFTKIAKSKNLYSYFFDYLFKYSIQGDATHIIKTPIAKKYSFSKATSNGEEWFYFIQLPYQLQYADLDTTTIGQYSPTGLNAKMKNIYSKNTYSLFFEISSLKMFVYLSVRLVFQILKKLIPSRN